MPNALLHPNGAVATRPTHDIKVQRMARPPAPWGWTIHLEGEAFAAYASEKRYRSADEAWEAARKALLRVRQGECGSRWHGATAPERESAPARTA
jgi:hypothetical protein